jgi:hypothetical protein
MAGSLSDPSSRAKHPLKCLARTHLQQLIIAVALNVIRTLAWLSEVPRGPTRVSRWVALAAPS